MEESNVTCVYCKESGFDLIGLKSHLLTDCDVFTETKTLLELLEELNEKRKIP